MSPFPEVPIYRLVLWNIDLTLLDVGRVTRAAYADAFRLATGRPLVRLPQMAGRIESEIFFEALALNSVGPQEGVAAGEELLARFAREFAVAFGARRALLVEQGRLLRGAHDAVANTARLPGMVQTVLTGSIKPNAIEKLRAFDLERFFDTEIGGYGSEIFPKGALLLNARRRAAEKYAANFTEYSTIYIADSARDVEAALVGGARPVAVATGRSSAGELREAGADVVFADLSDTVAVVDAVDRLTVAAHP
ncbi:MAG TPA: haloacid dehalogenase-like hydrolase [Streptosporangiaceae bacterium]